MSEYCLNVFVPIVKYNNKYRFGGSDQLSGYKEKDEYLFNEKEEMLLLKLAKGDCISITELSDTFEADTLKYLIENHVLIKTPKDDMSIFSRTDAFYEINKLGALRKRLLKKRILILGCGGIGTHIAWNMVTIGVGELVLVDFDTIELSNLNRQLMYDTNDVGKLKTEVLCGKLKQVNPYVNIKIYNMRISSVRDLEGICNTDKYDLIMKSIDTPENIMDWLDEVSEKYSIPYITAIATASYSMIGPTYVPHISRPYHDFFKEKNKFEHVSGIVPSLSLVIYNMAGEASLEAFKLLIGMDNLRFLNCIHFQNIIEDRELNLYPDNYDNKLVLKRELCWHKNNLIIGIMSLLLFMMSSKIELFYAGLIYILISDSIIFKSKRNAMIGTIENTAFFILLGIITIVFKSNLIQTITWGNLIQNISSVFVILSFILLSASILVTLIFLIKNKIKWICRKFRRNRA